MSSKQTKQYTLEISPISVGGFNDLDDELTQEFKTFYRSFFARGEIILTPEFLEASKKTFDNFDEKQRVSLGDAYFNNFTVITGSLLRNKQYSSAFYLWTEILKFVAGWEKDSGKKLHKGTPYYFSAVASILQNDFDAGLMSMYNALKEDKANISTDWDKAPGYFFMSLNDKEATQYFKPFVDGMIGFIRDRLDGKGTENGKYRGYYSTTRKGKLTYDQFRAKFLDNKNLEEEIRFYFVYSTIRLWHLRKLHKNKVGDDLMAPLIFSSSIFGLLLIIDELLKKWNNPGKKRKYFSDHFDELARKEGWNLLSKLDVNKRRDIDFTKWSTDLFVGSYQTIDGKTSAPLERDFILAYGLRNFSAHTISSQAILWQNYTKVLQSILNCLFKTIELL